MVDNINRGSGFPIRREFVLRFALMKILGKDKPKKSFEPEVFLLLFPIQMIFIIHYKDQYIENKIIFRNQRKKIMSQNAPSSERKI